MAIYNHKIVRKHPNGLTVEVWINEENEESPKPFRCKLRRQSDGAYVYCVLGWYGKQNTLVTGLLRRALDFDEVSQLIDETRSWIDDRNCVYMEKESEWQESSS